MEVVMKKSTLITSLFLVLLMGAAFAEGAQEGDAETVEEQSFTGFLDLSDGIPRLNVGSVSYILQVPRVLPEGLTVIDGQELTVSGYIKERPRHMGGGYYEENGTQVIGVTKALINGEEYEISQAGHGAMGGGPKRGGPGGRGRRPRKGGGRAEGGSQDPGAGER